MSLESKTTALPIIGWREWVKLPDFGVRWIKAKVDSGARSSSLHATSIEEFIKDGQEWVRFNVHPWQKKIDRVVQVEAPVLEYRSIRSSSGVASRRPVIVTTVVILGRRCSMEVTLANRSKMGFRMLLGREAFRGLFLLDAGNSYFGKTPKRKKNNEA